MAAERAIPNRWRLKTIKMRRETFWIMRFTLISNHSMETCKFFFTSARETGHLNWCMYTFREAIFNAQWWARKQWYRRREENNMILKRQMGVNCGECKWAIGHWMLFSFVSASPAPHSQDPFRKHKINIKFTEYYSATSILTLIIFHIWII